jgi:hypothetical protein
LRISWNVAWMSDRPSTYSPKIQRTPRNVLPDLISMRVCVSLSHIDGRRCGNFSTTSL